MLTFIEVAEKIHRYEFGPEDAYVQYRYASSMPWQYLASLCAAVCRRARIAQVVYYAEGTALYKSALEQPNAAWMPPASMNHPSQDIVLASATGSLLYPSTRDGLERGAELIWRERGSWCRLVRDRDFKNRLLVQSLSGDAMLSECEKNWIAEIRPDYEDFEIVEGPCYSAMAELLPCCIADVNADYS
ncbi:MAG TPA: hypothetical protein VFE35_05890 [Candidatus Cybelea sp.]|nr:hypothetical protein [Candidatus Cybelea sp.]